jgi:hypothetical protein
VPASEELRRRLNGRPIRIGFPAGYDKPFFVTVPAGCVGLNCTKTGAYVELMREILDSANVVRTIVEVSNASKAASPLSCFTACVHEVSNGGANLCIGPLW